MRTIARFYRQSDKISHNFLLFSGSNPVEGSSRNIIFGSPTKAMATESLRLIPPDSSFDLNAANFYNETSLIAISVIVLSYFGDIPFNLA